MQRLKILLVDADSTIPNLALMKLSRYYKSKLWADVKLLRLNIPYYPDRKRELIRIDTEPYNEVFVSCVFEGSSDWIQAKGAVFGGPGVTPLTYLSKEVDDCEPDYSLYSAEFVNDTSYGFITRGLYSQMWVLQST